MQFKEYSDKDLWRMLTLYGLNTATYKIALGQCICNFKPVACSIDGKGC